MARRRIDGTEGMNALSRVAAFFSEHARGTASAAAIPEQLRDDFLRATRFALEEIAERHPGRSVEIRVPYAGAVQACEGQQHRRGTPPNVVEAEMPVFLGLVLGHISWQESCETGAVQASGTRSNLSTLFPLFTPATLERYRDTGDKS
ncbi:MAG: hypothetical protein IKS49_03035 [Actinomycetaceae bacterium]|nr:hypothetical protein [Actinomycetaceae bacterium]